MDNVTVLLIAAPARTWTGTKQPVSESSGIWTTIWSNPEQHGARPEYSFLRNFTSHPDGYENRQITRRRRFEVGHGDGSETRSPQNDRLPRSCRGLR